MFNVYSWPPCISLNYISITFIIFIFKSFVKTFLIEFYLIWWQYIHLVSVLPFSYSSMQLKLFFLEKSSFLSIHRRLNSIKFINRVLKIGIIQVLVLGNIQWARTSTWIYIWTHFMNFAYICLFLYIFYCYVIQIWMSAIFFVGILVLTKTIFCVWADILWWLKIMI